MLVPVLLAKQQGRVQFKSLLREPPPHQGGVIRGGCRRRRRRHVQRQSLNDFFRAPVVQDIKRTLDYILNLTSDPMLVMGSGVCIFSTKPAGRRRVHQQGCQGNSFRAQARKITKW